MRKKCQLIILGVILAFCNGSIASIATHQTFPKDLIYSGKPIDSLCFSEDNLSKDNTIDLRTCTAIHDKYVVKDSNKKLQDEGFIGYDWVNNDMNGYTYYRFYYAGNNQYWIYALNNGGGNGNFTNIYIVTRKDSETIYVKGGISGNDCWAGIDNVSEKNHVLTYSINLTTSGLIKLANDKLSNDLTDDLGSCPHTCCIAVFSLLLNIKILAINK